MNKKYLVIIFFLIFSILTSSYYLYFFLTDSNIQIFNSNEITTYPSPDEFYHYAPKISSASEFNFGDPNLKEYSDKINLQEPFPLLFFGLLTKLTNLNVMFVFSLVVLTLVKLGLLFIFFSKFIKKTNLNLLSSLLVLVVPKFFLIPAMLPVALWSTKPFSLDFFIFMAPYISNFYSFRIYYGLFSLVFVFLSIFILVKLFFEEISWTKIYFYTLVLALNFYIYFYQWLVISVVVLLLTVWLFFKKRKMIYRLVIINSIFFLVGLPAIINVLLRRLTFPDPERYSMAYGFLMENLTQTSYYLLIPSFTFVLFSYLHYKKLSFRTLRDYFSGLLKNKYSLVLLVSYGVSLVLSNMNLIMAFPQPLIHNAKFLEWFLAMVIMLQISLYIKQIKWSSKNKKKWFNRGVNLLIVGVIMLVIASNLFLINHAPFKQLNESRTELYDFMNGRSSGKIIMTIDPEESTLLRLYTKNYVFLANSVSSLSSNEENLDRLNFAANIMGLNKTLVAKDLLSKEGSWGLHHYLFHGTYSKITRDYKVEWRLSREDKKELIKGLIRTPQEYNFDYVLIGSRERRYRFAGLGSEFSLVFKNEDYELYEKIVDK